MKFNAQTEIKKIISFIQDYFNKNNLDGVVIGISGGKDSTIVSSLFAKALGPENVIGINMPCQSLKEDETDAKRVADHIGFQLYNFDLTKIFEIHEEGLNKTFNFDKKKIKEAAVNLKPRLRMSSLYYVAQGLSIQNNKNYIVAGTSNKCEIYVGYFTKFGDGASDINVLADLTVSEVLAIGDALGLPKDLVHKPPADGLSGKTDEERLGFTYQQVEEVIKGNLEHERITHLHRVTSHKRRAITIYKGSETDEEN